MHQRQLVVRPHLKYSSQYNPCPQCGNLKHTTAELCWNCRYARPAIIQPDDPATRHIPLTKGKIARIDASDYEKFDQHHWCAMWCKDVESYYAVRVINQDGKKHTLLMHRAVMNALPDQIVDHINHNTLDNRRSNLRIASPSESQHNKLRQRNNTSGFIGVDFFSKTGQWRARIVHHNVEIHLGLFDTPKQAAQTRDRKAIELRGRFAVLNFPWSDYL